MAGDGDERIQYGKREKEKREENGGMVLVREVISEEHRVLFPFESFNRMQSVLLPQLLGSDENMVVAAPTGSGKTVVHELAILRCYLQKAQEDQDKGKGNDNSRIKCVSIMPNKALCQQVCMYVCMYVYHICTLSSLPLR